MLSTKIRQKRGFRDNNFYKDIWSWHVINFSKFTRFLESITNNELKQFFQNKIVELATKQPRNVRKILTKAKFEENPLPPPNLDFYSVMIVFIPDVEISSRANLFNLK